MQIEEMRLDGNSAAGELRTVFTSDMTMARATCVGCGEAHELGALLLYGQAMGTILRCPGCNGVMLRVVRTPTATCLEATGIAVLVIPS